MVKNPNKVKNLIGLVPQDIALYPNLTAKENLRYFGRLFGLKGKYLEKRVNESLDFVELTRRCDDRIATYSGGMKRRINLAAGLLHEPKILFLDEPTVGIDAQSRNMILGKLAFVKEKGTTLIYTTHYMEEAQHLCTKVVFIDQGRRIAQGRPQELIARSRECDDLGQLFLKLTGKELRDL